MSRVDLPSLATASQDEVARQMTICNACRYCEGLCAVFPAMELRRVFEGPDADYLANLCHNCGACYYDCQYAPPHEFGVNVPQAMTELREESYARFAWPRALAPIFARNGLWIALISMISVAGFILGFALWSDPGALTASGNFYAVMPHNAMVALFGPIFLFSLFAMGMSVRQFWQSAHIGNRTPVTLRALWQAMRDAGKLRYLDGGGMGCMTQSTRPDRHRRVFHHFTFYGFLLCFASTSSGTIMHYLLDWPAPYGFWTPPKLLGVPGGLGLVIGAAGLIWYDLKRDDALRPKDKTGMGPAFTWTLLALGATGLALYWLRETPAMGVLLALHLGTVFAFFLTMPYGKFMHGLYRFAALTRHAHEQATHTTTIATAPIEGRTRA
ncbi:tricarballylate utilization 4Fe-4S protein TcuB [Cognatiyoonia sp. IB215182]|uniref:tricarballylate utilization 4Fe-4S protein TcuB n=1 Tax=Cognatiyoonia sp. IB215182 TaxID=3097353 RepID=UPI002A153004|nr:tricarballylate utilization 4Fe-4S protein TcuB [Cognatiyoonia sp. IB215182]MDX8352445.1 tricarballylate utilization 4Fe-4S protein TcuB [Cognatiyoonia sp. IB215182]